MNDFYFVLGLFTGALITAAIAAAAAVSEWWWRFKE